MTAIVTGAGQGIGRGIAVELARAGAALAIADIDAGKAEDTVGVIQALGREAVALQLDVADDESVSRCVAHVVEKFSRVNVLVNNAGVFQRRLGLKTDGEDFDRCLDINITGIWRMSLALVPHFRAHGSGRIVNIASVGGRHGVDFAPAYCASKAGVINLTQSLALALGPDNITVNAVCPGAVGTAMQDQIRAALSAERVATRGRELRPALAGPLTAADIGYAVTFFASEWAKSITGQALNVDCGELMN
jgi:NAD(P)-dependent dehydrogenase (short-subunit alcohol dehydrogenase family)